MQGTGKPRRPCADDQYIRFQLFSLYGHELFTRILVSLSEQLGFGFFEGFGEGGHDFEDVGYYTVVGDFEDRGILVFVNGYDGARAFHADYVLDGAADA